MFLGGLFGNLWMKTTMIGTLCDLGIWILMVLISRGIRMSMMEIYEIECEDSGADCIMQCFCCPCAMSQMARHVNSDHNGPLSKPDTISGLPKGKGKGKDKDTLKGGTPSSSDQTTSI
jgi:hypothetical protein